MRSRIKYEAPVLAGRAKRENRELAVYLDSMNEVIADTFERITKQMNDAKYITVDGKSAEKILSENRDRRGDIKVHYGQWGAAVSRTGYVVCDGRNGTPPIHPSPSDSSSLQRFIRGTAWGCDAGGTAGAATGQHTHTATVTDPEHFHDVAGDVNSASPTASGTTQAESATTYVTCGSCLAAACGHTHTFSVTVTHSHTFSNGVAANKATGITVANSNESVATIPPCVDLIFLMKLRD